MKALGHISNFIFYSLDMCPNSMISYTKNYQNLSQGLCPTLPGFFHGQPLKWYSVNMQNTPNILPDQVECLVVFYM